MFEELLQQWLVTVYCKNHFRNEEKLFDHAAIAWEENSKRKKKKKDFFQIFKAS